MGRNLPKVPTPLILYFVDTLFDSLGRIDRGESPLVLDR